MYQAMKEMTEARVTDLDPVNSEMSAGMGMMEEMMENFVPEVERYADGLVPADTMSESDERKIRVIDKPNTMPKRFFDANRTTLYTELNNKLRQGRLSGIVGFRFTDKAINRKNCNFIGWDFWRIDRENFFTDVRVRLTLMTATGLREWNGYISVWCSFEEKLVCTIEDIGEETPDREGMIRLSPFMVPYFSGGEIDEACERIWATKLAEGLNDPERRKGEKLAEVYGLKVVYLPVFRGEKVASVLYFAAGKIQVDKKTESDEIVPEEVEVEANTIVVNTNRVEKEYASYCIFHEIIHYEYHYLFFRLQEMWNNDIRNMKLKEITLKPDEKVTDPIYWMEKQANRGAYALLMPGSWLKSEIEKERKGITSYRHLGELYEVIGRRICTRCKYANFRMRARMIQLGYIEAKGSLHYIDGRRIEPFAFDLDSCRQTEQTFIIDLYTAGKLYEENEDFRKIYDTGKFILADGHIVRDDPRYVRSTAIGKRLTPWANKNVDKCCLRFQKQYVQMGVGRYYFGRMNLDTDYIQRTMFYLEDKTNQEVVDEMEAEMLYIQEFPIDFREGLKQVMETAGVTIEAMAEKLNMEPRTLQRHLANPEKYMTVDFIMAISLILELPDWLSDLLFDRADLRLSTRKPRDLALQWVRRTMWKDGVDVANRYLVARGHEPLHI